MKKQKGTGGARAGSIKNPLFRGGGRIFGPEPRDYTERINVKVKKLARRSALSYKAKDGSIKVLEAFEMAQPKTQEIVKIFKGLDLAQDKTLVVLPQSNDAIYRSCRNLPKHRVMVATDLSTYDIMNCKTIVFVDNAHEVVQGLLK